MLKSQHNWYLQTEDKVGNRQRRFPTFFLFYVQLSGFKSQK